ncbi:MAG TPA: OmpA family protein [Thermoanaerobaculaceae bacterium]|nr:OmpA family protein [Thermoanaerobaculaceae bacterium]
MKKVLRVMVGALLLAAGAAAEQKDATGCKDHPLFTRMPEYWIHNCRQTQFDSISFEVAQGKKTAVEGQFWQVSYYPQATLREKPSELQIIRNFENAVQKLGGKVVFSRKSLSTLVLTQGDNEFWIEVTAEFTGKHGLRIVQRGAMQQDIAANAAAFSNDIRATGHAAVYGITFDTDSASIKPESAQAIGEIAKLLKGDPALKIFVVGHTDATGSVDHNLKLSQDRAQAVLQALVRDHGIAAARLRSFGCGPFAPVASNDSEDGKAKNRRVELVKQ